jgi:hypothetical protein
MTPPTFVTRSDRRRARPSPGRRKVPDALGVLACEHAEIDAMFERLRAAPPGAASREAQVRELCAAIRRHMLLEEEIVDPVLRSQVGAGDGIEEAQAQHDAMKPLLAQLASMRPGDHHYDACVAVLGEYLRLHVEHEHDEVFPLLRTSGIDLRALGEQLLARKRALTSATVMLGGVLTTNP